MLQGLVVLWGTEKCYFEAWRWAGSFASGASSSEGKDGDGDGDAEIAKLVKEELIPNWTSDAFGEFVEELGGLVDEVWRRWLGSSGAAEREGREGREGMIGDVGKVWGKLLEVERIFWPVVE